MTAAAPLTTDTRRFAVPPGGNDDGWAAFRPAFERDGFVVLRDVLTENEVAKMRSVVDAQLARRNSPTAYDFQAVSDAIWSDDEPDAGGATRFDVGRMKALVRSDPLARRPVASRHRRGEPGRFFYEVAGWLDYADMREVALDSALPKVAYDLLDTAYVNFWEDVTFVKEPGAVLPTEFHSDYGYFQISGEKCVIVWVPLDEAGAENGTLEVVRGSHLWGGEVKPGLFFATTPIPAGRGERLPDIGARRDEFDIVACEASPGDVVVMHVRLVHGAGGNGTDDRTRRAVSLRYCGDDVRYDDKEGALKQDWLNHDLRTGDALFHPDYPLVWPKPYPQLRVSDLYRNAAK